jgi:hypothetical protein
MPPSTTSRIPGDRRNLANFGVQERREKDRRLIAEMMGWFDLVTVQDVANDLSHLYEVREPIRGPRVLMISDTAGNDERAAFVYDPRRSSSPSWWGECRSRRATTDTKLPGVAQGLFGFDRSPYLAAFRAGTSEQKSPCERGTFAR